MNVWITHSCVQLVSLLPGHFQQPGDAQVRVVGEKPNFLSCLLRVPIFDTSISTTQYPIALKKTTSASQRYQRRNQYLACPFRPYLSKISFHIATDKDRRVVHTY